MKELALKYGCNPNQKPSRIYMEDGSELPIKVLNGRPGYINFLDAFNGWQLVSELKKATGLPAATSFKHVSPAGAAVGLPLSDTLAKIYWVDDLGELSPLASAYARARGADRMSSFGDFISLSDVCDVDTAKLIKREVSDGVIAPGYEPEALEILMLKKNLRLLSLPSMMKDAPCHKMKAASGQAPQEAEEKESSQTEKGISLDALDLKKVSGGLLVQQLDQELYQEEELKVVTKRTPTLKEWEDLKFAMIAVKHIKSNGIVLAKDEKTIGMGPGQTNRIWAVEHAIKQATEDTKGAVLASDAFFPFDDCVTAAAAAGITAIIQPGGSKRDDESIQACNEHNIAMVFTGARHFRH